MTSIRSPTRTILCRVGVVPALLWLLLAGCAAQPARHDERLARAELLAMLQTLNADLLSHDSATLTLERWCGDHRLAEPPRVVARRIRAADQPVPDDVRSRLAVGADEPIGYRHVQLVCGDQVLSEADNWYLPARLTPGMNHALDTTDEPFGKVVKSLGFQRHTLSARLLWSPLPPGWELGAPQQSGPSETTLRIPHAVLRHEAVLSVPGQAPFSTVVETYTSALFAFGDWRRYVEDGSDRTH